jgi:hypothetical protein
MTTKAQVINPQNKLKRVGVSSVTKMLMGMFAAVPIALTLPAEALEVQILPEKVKLGDTISVLIELEREDKPGIPTVTVGEQTYPAFEIAPNKYSAFIPTTPL